MPGRSVSVSLRANVAPFVAGMRTAAGAVGTLERRINSASGAQRQALQNTGRAATVMAAGLVGGFLLSVRASMRFEQQMSSVRAAAQASAADMKKLSAAAISAGKSTAFSATEAAKGEEELVKAGVNVADILGGGLKGALDLASAGQLEVGEASEIAATAMTQFALSGKDVPHIADLLAAGAGKAQGSVHDLGYALKMSGLVASQFGLSVDDTVGTLAAFASAGLIGSDAGTSLKTMLLHLVPTSDQAKEAMASLGINAFDAQGKFIGLTNLSAVLQKSLGGLTEQQRSTALATIFGTDAIRGANVLFKQGAEGIQKWINKTNDSGFAAKVAGQKLDNLSGDLTKLKGAIDTALIQGGSAATTGLRGMAQAVTATVNAYSSLPRAVQGSIFGITGLTGAALLGGAALIFVAKTIREARVALIALGVTGPAVTAALGSVRTAMAAIFATNAALNSTVLGLGRALNFVGGVMTGPWGLAVAGAIALTWAFTSGKEKAAKATTEFTEAIKADSGELGKNTREAVNNRLEQEGLLKTAQDVGLNLGSVTDAVLGNSDAYTQVNKQIDDYINSLMTKKASGQDDAKEVGKQILAATNLKGALKQQGGELKASVESTKRLTLANQGGTAAQQQAVPAVQSHTSAMQKLVDTMNDGKKSADELKTAFDELAGKNIALDKALIGQRQAVRDAIKAADGHIGISDKEKTSLIALAEANENVIVGMRAAGKSTDQQILKQKTLTDQFIRQAIKMGATKAEAIKLAGGYGQLSDKTAVTSAVMNTWIGKATSAATSIKRLAARTGDGSQANAAYKASLQNSLPVLYALAHGNAGAKAQVDALARANGIATGATNISKKAFYAVAESMGFSTKKAKDLWSALNKIKSKKVHVDVDAAGHWDIAKGLGTPGGSSGFGRFATGGKVPALGPESSRAHDSVPALLRVDEHVWTPEEVDAVGGHGQMYRLRQLALAGQLKGYAKGGAVSMSSPSVSSAAVTSTVLAPINAGFTSMIGNMARAFAAAWKKFAGSGGSVVEAARSQIGLPYSWGGGGTGGPSYGIGRGASTYGFDCCLVPGTLVQTVNGPKRIVDIEAGDQVFAWDRGELKTHSVVARSDARLQKTYRLRTHRRAVEASGNHPFLRMTRRSHGPGRKPVEWTPEWVHLEDLRPGDVIATLSNLPDRADMPADPWHADPDYLWLLGLALADGTMSTQRRNRVMLCKFGETRELAQERLERLIGRRATEHATHGMYVHDEGLAEALHRDGMDVTSSDRRVPEFVWALPHKLMQEFLDGYDAGDGCVSYREGSRSITYGATSRELIDGVRNLHIVLGHNVTNVTEWVRSAMPVIKGKTVQTAKPMWRFTAYPESNRKANDLLKMPRLAEIFPEGSHFQPEKILAIDETGLVEETYDIEVEGAHNFIADGVVVHNSGLTEFAWWKGRHKDIGGVTDSQWANSTPISGPRPGALAFPSGPGVHVMLGSNRPGYVIQAPHTGAFVEEVPRTSGNWRWPTGMHSGGEVKLGEKISSGRGSREDAILAKVLQIAGSGPRRGEDHTAQIAPAGGMRLWAEPETGGEAYIPLAASKRARSKAILAAVARTFGMSVRGMANGGIIGFADGGIPDVNLSDILSSWNTEVDPATASDVTDAKSAKKTQSGQVTAAAAALKKARQTRLDRIHDAEKRLARAEASKGKGRANRIADAKEDLAKARRTDTITKAEAKLKKEREDLAAATKKLSEVEKKYQYTKMSPATQLGSALGLSIKNKGAFIANLTKLADRGFGVLAQQLLTMGGTEAEKIAADAVKLSNGKLTTLQNQIKTSATQQQTLEDLPNILTVRSAAKSLGSASSSWKAMLNATGLDPGSLATAVHLMSGDLGKTTAGKALLADMQAHGYASGGWIGGISGRDRNLVAATAGEFMIRQRQASKYGPLIEAINNDQVGNAMLRRYISGGNGGSRAVRGGDGASAAPAIHQTFNHPEISVPQLAREAAREAAWALS
jgi:TP901 family phage tail tape measure protein